MNKQVIEALSKIVNVSASDLASAIEGEESDVKFDVAKTFKDEEWRTFEVTLQKEKDAEYNKGKDVGARQFVRDAKEATGLNYEGKDGDLFLDKYKEKIINDIGENPDERVSSLTKDLNILRDTSKQEIETLSLQNQELNKKYNSLKNGNAIRGYAPNKPDAFSLDDAVFLMERELSFEKNEDGQEVVIKEGDTLKSKTREPISWEQGVKDYWIEKDWIAKEEGRGKNSTPRPSDPNKFTKMSEMEEHFEEKGINPLSSEARAMINEAGKENSDFDYNS